MWWIRVASKALVEAAEELVVAAKVVAGTGRDRNSQSFFTAAVALATVVLTSRTL